MKKTFEQWWKHSVSGKMILGCDVHEMLSDWREERDSYLPQEQRSFGEYVPMDSGQITEENREFYIEHGMVFLQQSRDDLEKMADFIHAWCEAVKKDANWDGWDEFYKNASQRNTTIRELVEKYRNQKEMA